MVRRLKGDGEMRKTKGKKKKDLNQVPTRSEISVQPGEADVKSRVVGLW